MGGVDADELNQSQDKSWGIQASAEALRLMAHIPQKAVIQRSFIQLARKFIDRDEKGDADAAMKMLRNAARCIEVQREDTNGIEVDVRYHENELILEHDPYDHHNKKVTSLKDLLVGWNNSGPIILNLKSEGIENECINIMEEYERMNSGVCPFTSQTFSASKRRKEKLSR